MGFVKNIGKAIGGGVKKVGSAVSTVAKATVDIVTDPIGQIPKLPGAALNAALWLPHTVAQVGGTALEAAGKITGSERIESIGKSVQRVDELVVKGSLKNPIASAELLGGAILVGTGIGGVAGAGLLGKGALGVAGSALGEAVQEVSRPPNPNLPTIGIPGNPRPPPSLPGLAAGLVSSAVPPPPSPNLLERLIAWLRELIN